jgi:hypothetical protein
MVLQFYFFLNIYIYIYKRITSIPTAYFKSFVLSNQSWPPKIIIPTQLRTKTPYYKSLSLIIHKTPHFFPSLSLSGGNNIGAQPRVCRSPTQTSLVLPPSLSLTGNRGKNFFVAQCSLSLSHSHFHKRSGCSREKLSVTVIRSLHKGGVFCPLLTS